MDSFRRLMRALSMGLFALLVAVQASEAAVSIIGSKETVSAASVQAAIMNSSLNNNLKQYSSDIGQLAMFESGGRLGVYNGSCCTGILQMNRSNLAAQGFTPESYANASLETQVEAWAKLTNSAANSAPVRQLMGMESFDGQKVDGALVLSCIQLGIGNCQKMLRSGSCSGFADSNGTNICQMAAKMRGGENAGSDSKPTTETPKNTDAEQSLSTMILENADKCWVCTIIVKTGEVAVQIVPSVIEKLTSVVLPLMAVVFGLVIAFMIGRGFIWPGLMNWSDIFWNTARFTAVYALISVSAFASEYVMGYVFYPSLQVGVALGEMGASQGTAALQSGSGNQKCRFVQVGTGISYQANSTISSMSDLACKVHLAAYNPVVAGATLMSAKTGKATASEIATGIVIAALALLMIISSLLALAAFGMSVVEALLKLAIVLSLSPIILFFWIFRRTRYLAANAFNLVLYGVFLLALSGTLASISAFVMSRLVAQGMGQSGGNPSLSEVYQWVNTKMGSVELSQVVLFASFAIAASMMAAHLLRAGSDIASSLTGARMGQITNGVIAGVRGAAMMSFAAPAAAVGMGTAYFGARAGLGALGAGAAGVINGSKSVVGAAGRLFNKGSE